MFFGFSKKIRNRNRKRNNNRNRKKNRTGKKYRKYYAEHSSHSITSCSAQSFI